MIHSTVEIIERNGAIETRLGKAFIVDINGSIRDLVSTVRMRADGLNGLHYCIREMTQDGSANLVRISDVVAADDQEAPFLYSVRLDS